MYSILAYAYPRALVNATIAADDVHDWVQKFLQINRDLLRTVTYSVGDATLYANDIIHFAKLLNHRRRLVGHTSKHVKLVLN